MNPSGAESCNPINGERSVRNRKNLQTSCFALREVVKLVLGDVARVELGAQSYAFLTREDGKQQQQLLYNLRPVRTQY